MIMRPTRCEAGHQGAIDLLLAAVARITLAPPIACKAATGSSETLSM